MCPYSSCANISIGTSALRFTGYAFCSFSNFAANFAVSSIPSSSLFSSFFLLPSSFFLLPSSFSSLFLGVLCVLCVKSPPQQLPDLHRLVRVSPVHFPQHNINRPDARDHVRDQLTFDDHRQRLQVDERRRPEVHPQRMRRAVARHVASQFASRRLHRRESVSRRRRESFREYLEVVDERFHLRLHLFPLRRNDSRRFRFDRSGVRDFRHGLLDDLQALPHFRHADHVPPEAVRIRPHRHVKLKFLVARIRKRFT